MVFIPGLSPLGSDGSLDAILKREGKQCLFPVGTRTERASWRLCVVHEVAATTSFMDLSIGWLGYSDAWIWITTCKKNCNFPLSFTKHWTHCSSDLTVVPDLPKSTTDRLHKKSKKTSLILGKGQRKTIWGKKSFFLNVKACDLHTVILY